MRTRIPLFKQIGSESNNPNHTNFVACLTHNHIQTVFYNMDQINKKTCAVDTSSLIFLFKAHLLEKACLKYIFSISFDIWNELTVKASENELETYAKIARTHTTQDQIETLGGNKKFSQADKSLIHLIYNNSCKVILSEDGHILRYCKKNNIQHYCCLSLITELYHENLLSLTESRNKINEIRNMGWYAPWVVETAFSMLER